MQCTRRCPLRANSGHKMPFMFANVRLGQKRTCAVHTFSVRQTADWFKRTMSQMPIVVARCDGVVAGYALATSIAAKSHVGIVQSMLRAFPAPPNCYLYGPVCVSESERGNGLAGMMYQEM